jgi:hypothetical protein
VANAGQDPRAVALKVAGAFHSPLSGRRRALEAAFATVKLAAVDPVVST